MRKVMCFVFFVSLLVVSFNLSAAYNIKNTTIFTAQVTVTGTTNTALEIAIFNRIDDSAATVVEWTNISLPLGGDTSWRVANQYVKIVYTNYNPAWGISFGSDNFNSAIANPLFTGATNNAGGLVGVNNTASALPLVWQIQDDTTTYDPPQISDPVTSGSSSYFTNTGWAWKYLVDQAPTTSFWDTSGNDSSMGSASVNYYVTPINQAGRLWGGANNERGGGSSPMYLYLAADFATATAQQYKTTTLTVEMFQP